MPNKKKQRNGFYFFMKELQDDYAKKGRHVKMDRMPELAHPKWKQLPQQEQDRYTQMAKKYKEDWKTTEEGKMDCFGCPLNQAQDVLKKEERKEQEMIANITKSLQKLASREDIIKQNFYFIHFNYACKTDDKVFIPSEVGIIEYSIEKGVKRDYHKFIKPTDIPIGFKFTCIEESEQVHGIPHENFELADDDYATIYSSIKSFVQKGGGKQSQLHVYTYPEYIEQTELCLDWLHKKSFDGNAMNLHVYDLLILFENLRRLCQKPITASLAREFMSKTCFNYIPNIGCKFHDQIDRPLHCAIAIPKRTVYLLSDYLCDQFEVDVIPGAHMPEADDDNFITVKSRDFAYSTMSDESKKYAPKNEEIQYAPKPVISRVGKSAVFEPDSKEIFGFTNTEKDKLSEAAAGPSPKRAVRCEPPTRYNQAVVGWTPRENAADFQIDKDDFPALGDNDFPALGTTSVGRGVGRGVGRAFKKTNWIGGDNIFEKMSADIGRSKRK